MGKITNVEQPEADKKTSRIIDGLGATMQLNQEHAQCHWNDQVFARGDQVSIDGKTYECTFGCWVNTNQSDM